MKIYVDTNVIMDFLLGRDSNAFKLFMKSLECKYFVFISDIVLQELQFQELDASTFIKLLNSRKKIQIVNVREEEKAVANMLIKKYDTHYNDALHKIVAKRIGVDFIVTKNVKDFICFEDVVVKKPDEL